jgi:hypothetical protein
MKGIRSHDHGMGGRHFRTFSVKSSVGKLQSFSKALVSTSISPIGPSSSTKVPKGWRELMGFTTKVNQTSLQKARPIDLHDA